MSRLIFTFYEFFKDLIKYLKIMEKIAMPEIINVHQAKTQFSRLLKRAHEGEEIILAKAGKPYAKLVPAIEILT